MELFNSVEIYRIKTAEMNSTFRPSTYQLAAIFFRSNNNGKPLQLLAGTVCHGAF